MASVVDENMHRAIRGNKLMKELMCLVEKDLGDVGLAK